MSRNWIDAQVNTKVNSPSNDLTVEEWDTMLLSVLTRKQGIKLKSQRKINQRTGRRERSLEENLSMLKKTEIDMCQLVQVVDNWHAKTTR